jgi:hypothetical protein
VERAVIAEVERLLATGGAGGDNDTAAAEHLLDTGNETLLGNLLRDIVMGVAE